MSRVLSLSLTDNLYASVSEHAEDQGLTVYQYVRKAVERSVLQDDQIIEMLTELDESGD